MSNENILRVHLNGIKLNDLEPNVAELTELLPKKDFRPLTNATPATLPVGAVVSVFNSTNHTMFLGVVWNHTPAGFNYLPSGQLNNSKPDNDDLVHMSQKYEFKNRFYQVIAQLPVVDGKPQLELLPKVLKEAGFRPLDEATPEDLPEGCVAILYENSYALTPVIVRVLSKQFANDHRFLYWCQNAITAGKWKDASIMDRLKKFKNYFYLVV